MCLSSMGGCDVRTLGFDSALFSLPLLGKGLARACASFVPPYTCCISMHKICSHQCLRYVPLRTLIFVYRKPLSSNSCMKKLYTTSIVDFNKISISYMQYSFKSIYIVSYCIDKIIWHCGHSSLN